MQKEKRVKIRLLLIVGVTLIFASSITPLIMMAVDNVKNLGGFAIDVGGISIEKGSKLLFLERIKAKANEYSEIFASAEEYIEIFKEQMTAVIEILPYYTYPNETQMKYFTSLKKGKHSSVIKSNKIDDVNFWYWGESDILPEKVKKDLDCYSLYYPLIKRISSIEAYFTGVWLLDYNDKFILFYSEKYDYMNKMPARVRMEAYQAADNIGKMEWSPIYNDTAGNPICSISEVITNKNDSEVRVGIDIDIDKLINDATDFNLLSNDININPTKSEKIKPFNFILGNKFQIISFPAEYYSDFGLDFRLEAFKMNKFENDLADSKYSGIDELINFMKKHDNGYYVLDINNHEYIITFARIKANNWRLCVVVPLDYLQGAARKTRTEINIITMELIFALSIMALMFFIVAIFLILVVFKEYLMNPISNLINGIAKISFKEKLKEEGAPEIVDLSKTFNKMTSELYRYMKDLKKEIETREKTENELHTARKIQEALLPCITELFENKNFDLYAGVLPANFVAGDFYDYFFISKNKLAFLVGDVSGKGISSAFYMTIVRSIVRDVCQQENEDPAKAVKNINRVLCQSYQVNMFVSLVLIYYDVESGFVQYINAGHPDILLVNADGISKEVKHNDSMILVYDENAEYESSQFYLDFDEMLVLFSDGILEGYNNVLSCFKNNLIRLLKDNYKMPLKQLCNKIFKSIRIKEEKEREDDFTLFIFKREHGGIKASEDRKILLKD